MFHDEFMAGEDVMADDATGKDDGGGKAPASWANLLKSLNIDPQEPSATSTGAAAARDMRQRLVIEQKIDAEQARPDARVVRLEATPPAKGRKRRLSLDAMRQAAREAHGKTRFSDADPAHSVAPDVDLPGLLPEQDIVWADPQNEAQSPDLAGQSETPVFGKREASVESPREGMEPPVEGIEPAAAPVEKIAPVEPRPEPVRERIILGVPLSAVVRYRQGDFMLASLDRPAEHPAPLAFGAAPIAASPRSEAPRQEMVRTVTLPQLPAAFGRFAAFGLIGLAGLVGIALILALGLLPTK